MIKIELERVAATYGFAAKDAYGHVVHTDGSPESGGINFGVRPMQLLLMGLGSCSGIDIVSILKKQRQTVEAFTMKIEGCGSPAKSLPSGRTLPSFLSSPEILILIRREKPVNYPWTSIVLLQKHFAVPGVTSNGK